MEIEKQRLRRLPRRKERDNRIDPRCLRGKTLSFIEHEDGETREYHAVINGLKAGRLRKIRMGSDRLSWTWTLSSPFIPPNLMPADGYCTTFDDAMSAFKKKFREWRNWAVQQEGLVPWAGADSRQA